MSIISFKQPLRQGGRTPHEGVKCKGDNKAYEPDAGYEGAYEDGHGLSRVNLKLNDFFAGSPVSPRRIADWR